jgi:MFS family permease
MRGTRSSNPASSSGESVANSNLGRRQAQALVGTLQAFGIYAVGFVSRPVGAALFGHYGDRIGRKVTLIATLLLTGLSTFAVGFVPGYASIGIWGAVILTVVRFIQGVGIGGEWAGRH